MKPTITMVDVAFEAAQQVMSLLSQAVAAGYFIHYTLHSTEQGGYCLQLTTEPFPAGKSWALNTLSAIPNPSSPPVNTGH
jgi:hypothetical protein